MAKLKNVYEFTDLLFHAETLGFTWNQAHKWLDELYPSSRSVTLDRYMFSEEETAWVDTPEGRQILESFFDKEKVNEITLVRS